VAGGWSPLLIWQAALITRRAWMKPVVVPCTVPAGNSSGPRLSNSSEVRFMA